MNHVISPAEDAIAKIHADYPTIRYVVEANERGYYYTAYHEDTNPYGGTYNQWIFDQEDGPYATAQEAEEALADYAQRSPYHNP